MFYSWATITNSVNHGNFLIEHNLKKILEKEGFPDPGFKFDCFARPSLGEVDRIAADINKSDFLIIPGCTTLTLTDYPALNDVLPKVQKTVFNIGATFAGKNLAPSLEGLDRFFKPIGVRDPSSQEYLTQNKVPNEFIGCPTLFSDNANKYQFRENKKVVFFLGYKKVEPQLKMLEFLLARGIDVRLVIQEENQLEMIKGIAVEKISYDSETVISLVKEARLVVTARLHGALPAIACGTPVFFIKAMDDFRFSLLEYLDIDFSDPDQPDVLDNLNRQFEKFVFCRPDSTYNKVRELRSKFLNYVRLIKSSVGEKTND